MSLRKNIQVDTTGPNFVLAGPVEGTGTPKFRSLQLSDIPLPSIENKAGLFLATNGSTLLWESTPYWMTNPMTASGDLIIGGSAGSAGRLGVGAVGQVLTVSSNTSVSWEDVNTVPGMNTLTNGLILSNNGGSPFWESINTALGISPATIGQILVNNGNTFEWVNNVSVPSFNNAAGQFLTNNGSSLSWNIISQVPSTGGNAGKLLTTDGASAFWSSINTLLPSMINSAGRVLTTDGTNISWSAGNGFTNPLTTLGDLFVGTTLGAPSRLPVGNNGQTLTVVGGVPSWSTQSVGLINPMTSLGDMIVGNASGVPARLGTGASGQVLTINDSGRPIWTTIPSQLPQLTSQTNQYLTQDGSSVYWSTPLPAQGGLSGRFLTTNGSTASWVAIPQIPSPTGFNGQFLTTDGTNIAWATVPTGFSNPMTTTGDLIAGNVGGTAGRLPIGTTGQVLTVSGTGPAWATLVIPPSLPAQTGSSGLFLTTNGSSASWGNLSQVPSVLGEAGFFLGNNGTTYSWMSLPNQLPTVVGQGGKFLATNGTISEWVPITTIPTISGSTSGQVLANNGVNAYWASQASSATLGTLPLTFTSSTLAVGGAEIDTIQTTCYTFQLQQISASSPCRIRLYSTRAQALADNARPASADPSGNTGLFAEFVFSSTALSWIVSPTVVCFNGDMVAATCVYAAIQNTSTSASAITITATLLKMS